jgi:ATP-dependent DNA ligase
MLAHPFEKYSSLCFTVPTYIQPKLDGIRCVSEDNTLLSRNDKAFVSLPHLLQSKYTLDGELYSHSYRSNFNKIVSLVKKQQPTKADLEASCSIEHWVYDMPSCKGVFSVRYRALQTAVQALRNPAIKVVPTYLVPKLTTLKELHQMFLEQGYEGSIVRLDLGDYEWKRSKQLLKLKDFHEEEFAIVDIEEGLGKREGTAGNLILALGDGRTFGAGVRGDFEYVQNVLKNKPAIIGRLATVRYFNKTPAGIPRFGVVTQIDRVSYEG